MSEQAAPAVVAEPCVGSGQEKVQRYYVYVPSILRRPGVRPELRLGRYPPRDVEPYDIAQAIDVLRIFNGRWCNSGSRPPAHLEPRAVRVDGSGEDITLYEVDRLFYGLSKPPSSAAEQLWDDP